MCGGDPYKGLHGAICIPCTTHNCLTCNQYHFAAVECVTCFPGDYRVKYTQTFLDDECLPCSSPCVNCVSSASTCLSCIANYDYIPATN